MGAKGKRKGTRERLETLWSSWGTASTINSWSTAAYTDTAAATSSSSSVIIINLHIGPTAITITETDTTVAATATCKES
jgi:hypothetical protein